MAKTPAMKPHAIMITIPYQGHVNPFVNLALKLASKGFKVTFINTEHVHHCITKSIITNNSRKNGHNVSDIFAEARDYSGLDIHYRTISDGFPLDYDRGGNFAKFWESLLKDFPSTIEDFVVKILSESSGDDDSLFVPILVADTFSPWAGKIAEKHKLVNVSFWTEPSLVFATCYYMDLLIEHGHFPPKDDKRYDNIDYIPGIESISRKDLPGYFNYEAAETLHIVQKIVFSSFDEVKKADFILHNTVQELEHHVLSSLNQTKPTYPIGPTNFYKVDEFRKTIVPKSFFRETDCSKWLDTKPYRSVLYISFGSTASAEKHVIEELARGLVFSEANFLWITRNHSDDSGSLDNEGATFPAGFRDEVNDKGLIVPWCDQAAVLSHRAIGGFLTHCGWNSVLESMWSGVPMICYPFDFDQPTNRKLAVDDWKIGLNLCDEKETITAEKFAEKIKKVMNITGENEMRREAEQVMKILHNALDDDGSSERNFNRFVDDLKDKIDKCVSKLNLSE